MAKHVDVVATNVLWTGVRLPCAPPAFCNFRTPSRPAMLSHQREETGWWRVSRHTSAGTPLGARRFILAGVLLFLTRSSWTAMVAPAPNAGYISPVDSLAHNQKAVGSNPTPATNFRYSSVGRAPLTQHEGCRWFKSTYRNLVSFSNGGRLTRSAAGTNIGTRGEGRSNS